MNDHFQAINALQILLPLIGSGAVLIGFLLFVYIYSRWKEKIFLGILFLSAVSFLFVFSEGMIIVVGSIFHQFELARQFHRIEQIFGAYFLFALPYALSYALSLDSKQEKINRQIAAVGLGIALFFTFIAFVFPDLFVSMTKANPRSLFDAGAFGRGKEGILYGLRDALLGLMLVYNIFLVAKNILVNHANRYNLLLLFGILIATYGAVDDILDVYWHFHIDFLPHTNFSRFTLGLTLFTISAMTSVIRRFLDQARQVEIAFETLNQSEERFQQIASHIHEVFWLFEMSPTGEMNLLYVNHAIETVWNIPRLEIYTQNDLWLEKILPDKRKQIIDTIKQLHSKAIHLEYPIHHEGSKIRWLKDSFFPIYNANNEVYRIARITEDISDQKLYEEKLSHLAYYDNLTELPNRKSFLERFEETLEQAKRSKSALIGLLFIDLDYFKEVNDSLGHSVGDLLLKKVASRLQSCIRRSDFLFRVGGDEFTVLLTHLNHGSDAAIVAHKMIEAIQKPFKVKGNTIYLGISIGIALYPRDGENSKTLMKSADSALYRSKKERNTYRFYTKDMQNQAQSKLTMIAELRRAIKNQEFELFYQPQIDLSGKFIGAEALLRWNHPDGKNIPPGIFIPIAEETGLIIPIGNWILENACQDFHLWNPQLNPKWTLSINLSTKQFKDKNLVPFIQDVIERHKISQHSVHLEITESILAENLSETILLLTLLKRNGIHFALDDFGTGYSSLSYLQKLPIHTLKIDRSFVLEIPHDKQQVVMVSSIIQMAKALDLSIIVEGIENNDQVEFLQKLDFPGGIQGYYYSKPLPMKEFIDFIHKNES